MLTAIAADDLTAARRRAAARAAAAAAALEASAVHDLLHEIADPTRTPGAAAARPARAS